MSLPTPLLVMPLLELKNSRFDAPTIAKLLEKQWWHAPADEIEKVKHSQFQVPAYINT